MTGRRRTVALAIAVCAALTAVTVAVPAMGGPGARKVAKQARKTVKKANRASKAAQATAAAALAKAGPTGPAGADSTVAGADGTGDLSGTLPVGRTLTGGWGVGGNQALETVVQAPIVFLLPLEHNPGVEIVEPDAPAPAACDGSVDAPTADSGFLCIYVGYEDRDVAWSWYALTDGSSDARYGVQVYADNSTDGSFRGSGTYAVTAGAAP